jgi:predicted transcriptional regulator
MNSSTWRIRELAILRAVVAAEERGDDPNQAAYEATDRGREEVLRTLARLGEDGFLEVRLNKGDDRIMSAHVVRALPKALREVELWPQPTTMVQESDRRRLIIMNELRRRRGDDTLNPIRVSEIAEAHSLAEEELANAVQYLDAEGLVEHQPGNQVTLTHLGLKEIETLEREPSEPTAHFPAIHISFGDHASGVQISAGSPGSHQQLEFSQQERDTAGQFVAEFRRVLPEFEVDETERANLAARLSAADALLSSPSADSTALHALLSGLQQVALGVAGNAAFAGLVELARAVWL